MGLEAGQLHQSVEPRDDPRIGSVEASEARTPSGSQTRCFVSTAAALRLHPSNALLGRCLVGGWRRLSARRCCCPSSFAAAPLTPPGVAVALDCQARQSFPDRLDLRFRFRVLLRERSSAARRPATAGLRLTAVLTVPAPHRRLAHGPGRRVVGHRPEVQQPRQDPSFELVPAGIQPSILASPSGGGSTARIPCGWRWG